MSDQLTLSAEVREQGGKGASRALRRQGRVPAVIYGNKEEPQMVHLEEKLLSKALHTGHFFNSLISVEIDGKAVRTLAKDVAFHPVSDRPLHVDFFRVGEHATVHVNVPVVYTNEDKCEGIAKGGVLNIVRHEVEIVCDAAAIPDHLEVDVSSYDVGDSIHFHTVAMPAGVKPAIDDRDFTLATISAPSALKSEEGEAAAAAEGEEATEDKGE